MTKLSTRTIKKSLKNIHANFSSLIDDLIFCDLNVTRYSNMESLAYEIIRGIEGVPANELLDMLITDLSRRKNVELDAFSYSGLWYSISGAVLEDKDLFARIRSLNKDSCVFEYLRALDEGDGTEAEANILAILSAVDSAHQSNS